MNFSDPTRQDTGRGRAIRLSWSLLWLFFLTPVVHDLATGGYGPIRLAVGSFGLLVVVVCYVSLVFGGIGWFGLFRRFEEVVCALLGTDRARQLTCFVLWVTAVGLILTFDDAWLGVMVYVSVSFGAGLRFPQSAWAIVGCVLTGLVLGFALDAAGDDMFVLAFVTVLTGGLMIGVRRLIETLAELREAREIVAQLSASEERLRMARDLHDVLGHSLSLITLKSELAGRFLPGHVDRAIEQVADIERVSRQALVDVREAVGGYRRPTFAVELAGARIAARAVGIELTVVPEQWPVCPDPDAEAVLSWALREAVTNTVRHSGARRCTVELSTGPTWTLEIADDGNGGAGCEGNGLTGLRERFALADGSISVDSSSGERGFRLTASVPIPAGTVGESPNR
ncbi:sensor histidine kinase [Streptomyces sp. SID3343]|uniref:sensor histidine kinase n=1 Tax=Streptomyces sp. SID3343 TaxID=2690260 RepID=UPI001368157E|nr:sensor histidine kinase [Streptomyces sp. SID3343]MYW03793.1 sensor histidine kinase [Streptomyces sp. SID3343]